MIKALSGIRFYLFLLILATHVKYIIKDTYCGDILFPYLNQGAFAVLFFFILSGFCIALGYGDKFKSLSLKDVKSFITKRLIKLYPLYLLTGIIFIFYNMTHDINSIWSFIFLYIPMLSPFTTNFGGNGNSAGWFVATICFCYLLSPLFIYLFHKIQKKYLLYFINYIVLILIAILLTIIGLSNKDYTYLYHFPPYRFLHFLLGLNLGLIYKANIININIKNFFTKSLLDIIIIFIFIISMFIFNKGFLSTNIILSPLFCLIIFYLCNENKSILNYILTNKVSLYLSNISMECYLIHYIFCTIACKYFLVHHHEFSYGEICILYFILLFITIISSILYCNFQAIIKTVKRFLVIYINSNLPKRKEHKC